MGSMGNGGAMRVAPLGAYWADDEDAVVREARASAEVTHAHPEGQAGAIAVAVAAAWACRRGAGRVSGPRRELLEVALAATPQGETRRGLEHALALPSELSPQTAASLLGSGLQVTSPDTVPFSLWCAARHLDDYEEALWATVSGLGDRDTTCAIVGGVVALATGRDSIPAAWLQAREPLTLASG
jgi:ADP-ribosylglycohydrolase